MVAGSSFIRRKHDMDALAKNRRSQKMKFVVMQRRLRKQRLQELVREKDARAMRRQQHAAQIKT
jgi:hypothetical protein